MQNKPIAPYPSTRVWHRPARLVATFIALAACSGVTQRNEVSFLRGTYNIEFYARHREAFRLGAALHFSHAKQHDVLLLTPLAENAAYDAAFDAESVKVAKSPPHTEPTQELFAPHTARAMWKVLRAIDWTHMLHEQTYDIMSDDDIAWARKQEYLDRAVRYYLDKNDVAFSPAPLDVTMRRAAVMMKPYFTTFRTHYPRSNNFFYAAHWWHPIVYEPMMVTGNGRAQDESVDRTSPVFFEQVLPRRPMRMLLAREIMPRYARLSPESANAFDNLHMFHGIVYDVLAYEGPDTMLVADVFRRQERTEDEETNMAELGIRRQVTPLLVLALGAGAGFLDESPRFRATAAFQYSLPFF